MSKPKDCQCAVCRYHRDNTLINPRTRDIFRRETNGKLKLIGNLGARRNTPWREIY